VTYKTEITALKKQIDRLDHEIIEGISELSQAISWYKQELEPNEDHLYLKSSDIELLALQFCLDVELVLKIFGEIAQLIYDEGVNQH